MACAKTAAHPVISGSLMASEKLQDLPSVPQPATFCRAAVAPGAYTLRRHTLNIKPFKTVILNRGTYACSRHKAFGILVCVQPSLRIQGLWHAVHTSCMAARAHRTVITTVAMTIRIQLTRVYRHPARKINLSVRFPSPYRKNRRTLLLFPGISRSLKLHARSSCSTS